MAMTDKVKDELGVTTEEVVDKTGAELTVDLV